MERCLMKMTITIEAKVRASKQQSELTDLRAGGFVPSVLYGYEAENTSIAVKERDLLNAVREVGRNGVIQLAVDGKSYNVVLHDYQQEPLKGHIEHADFMSINLKEELEVDVLINLVGESVGEKAGGTVEQPVREITITAKPTDIPETFDIDISTLDIGDSISVSDIRGKATFEILNDDEDTLVIVSAPRSEEELEALDEGTEEASAEPGVIGETEE